MNKMFRTSSIKLRSCSNHEKLIIVVVMVWSLLISHLPVQSQKICDQTIPIGILMNKQANDSEAVKFTKLAVENFNRELLNNTNSTIIQIQPVIEVLNDASPIQIVDALGKLIEQRIVALISSLEGPLHRIVLSYSNVFQIPLIHLDQTQNSLYVPGWYQLSIKPSFLNVLASVIQHFDWKNIVYLYKTEDGLAKLQSLFSILIRKKFDWKLEKIKQFVTAQDAHDFILSLELEDPKAKKYILLDCDAEIAKEIIIKHVNNIYLGRRNFHFLFTDLIIDDFWFKTTREFGAINITGLRVINPRSSQSREIFIRLNLVEDDKLLPIANQLNLEMALIYDSLAAISRAILDLSNKEEDICDLMKKNESSNNNEYLMMMTGEHSLECRNYLRNKKNIGQLLHKYLRYVKFNGFTGNVEFYGNTYRQNYKVDVVGMTLSSEMTAYASWTEKDGLEVVPSKLYRQANRKRFERRHVIITSILEEPFLMWRKGDTISDQIYEGNERFEGYCKDLADLLMSTMNLTYTLKLVNDSKYGAEDSKSPLGWNGLVGELIRKEADIALAPLTITSARERVIDFTKPFLETGISIMIKRPKKKYSDIFSFLNPLSRDIWIWIIVSYIGVSLVIFVVGKCSQKEWQKGSIGVYQDRFLDDFSLLNCFWFAIGAMLRQNSEISPRSFPARIAGGVWWFFTLIIISSYTANLAAFLTVERMITPINSADDLSKQTSIEYGMLRDSSTYEFFKNSQVQVFRTMYSFMISRPHVFLDSYTEGINRVRNSNGKFAFLLESTKNEYINNRRPCDTLRIGRNLDAKGYGIATPLNSALTVELNLKILTLKEPSELAKLEHKWWHERSECKNLDRNIDINQNSLSLTNVTGCFYILFFGLILAFIVSLIEYYTFKNDVKMKKLFKPKKGFDDKSISTTQGSRCPVHHDRWEIN